MQCVMLTRFGGIDYSPCKIAARSSRPAASHRVPPFHGNDVPQFCENAMILRLLMFGAIFAASIFPTQAGSPRSDRVSIVPVPNGGEAVDAQITPDGVIHLLYNCGDIPYYARSTDQGRSFSHPLPVVNNEARKKGLVFSGSSMAVGRGGAVYVAMMTNNWQVKLADVPTGFVYAMLAPGAKAFTPVRSLNNKPSEGFSLAADEKGDVAATWLSDKLYANFSKDGGRTFTPNAEINPQYNPCNCCTTRAAYGKDGNLAVLYREETNNDRDMYVVMLSKKGSQSRTKISSTPWKINACPMTYYSISAIANGYIAAWPTKGEIYFARLDRSGKVLAPGEIRTPGRSAMRSGLVALGVPDGTALIAWKRQDELRWQLYDRNGQAEGPVGSVSSKGKGAAGVVCRNGRFILFR